ncbi:TlpA family protein disulfide reductase [Nocardioides sp. Y6]|uniref:TlpA family protein disulfide reductase n=1 Tax=Nocardioides malaquae TaxID=2773426 RepID=A0ABR9RRS3_9ACTN|nr:TlpA family protein disulfide reductase [Nocardioides malaquae]
MYKTQAKRARETVPTDAEPVPRRTRGGRLVLVGVAVLLCATWVWTERSKTETNGLSAGESVIQEYEPEDRVRVGEFSGRLLDGGRASSADLGSKPVVFNVWGSWCVPCRTEAPALVRLAEETKDRATFIGINTRDSEASAKAFESRYKVPYPSITTEDNSSVTLALGSAAVTAVPTTIIVDHQGRIAARVVGPGTYTTFRTLLDEVLDEAPREATRTDRGD